MRHRIIFVMFAVITATSIHVEASKEIKPLFTKKTGRRFPNALALG